MPISTRQLVGSTFALLVLGFVALAVIIGATIWLGERERVYSRDLFEVRDVKALAVDLRAALQTAESSQRGYLYTGNEVYLAPYDLAKRRATAAAAGLPASLAVFRHAKYSAPIDKQPERQPSSITATEKAALAATGEPPRSR
jgi:CHASE3 domain sensor protein